MWLVLFSPLLLALGTILTVLVLRHSVAILLGVAAILAGLLCVGLFLLIVTQGPKHPALLALLVAGLAAYQVWEWDRARKPKRRRRSPKK